MTQLPTNVLQIVQRPGHITLSVPDQEVHFHGRAVTDLSLLIEHALCYRGSDAYIGSLRGPLSYLAWDVTLSRRTNKYLLEWHHQIEETKQGIYELTDDELNTLSAILH